MAGFCGGLTKVILISLNLVLCLGGVLLIGAGAYMQYQILNTQEFMENKGSQAGYFAAVLGAIIALVSFLGCCGLVKRSEWMMKLYGACVVVLLLTEIGCGIYAYVQKGEAQALIDRGMDSTLDKYNQNDQTRKPIVLAWDDLQQNLQCCGVTEYNDWHTSSGWDNEADVPDSCCKTMSDGCGAGSKSDEIYTTGCKEKLVEAVKSHIGVVASVGVGVGLVQVIAIIVAFCLGKKYGLEMETV